MDYGNSLDWDWSNKEYALKTYLGNYFNVIKYYGPETYRTPMCHEEQVTFYNTNFTYGWLTNVYISSPFHPQNNYSFLTNDGVCIGLGQSQTDGKHYIYIDINSSIKGPNKAGKDLFIFVFVNGTIKPWGYDKEDVSSPSIAKACNKKAPSGGGYCAEKIIRNGWEIQY